MAIDCRRGSLPLVRIAMYGDNTQLGESLVDGRYQVVDANVPALLRTAFCEDFGGSVAVFDHGVRGITTAINDVSNPGIDYSMHYQQWAEVMKASNIYTAIKPTVDRLVVDRRPGRERSKSGGIGREG